VAWATGFLLGDGRFVVTDLASVARPGVAQVTVRFHDGKTAVAREFGMADPAVGLAALKLDQPPQGVGGLALSSAIPGQDGTPVILMGWKHASTLDLVQGVLKNGTPAADVAAALSVPATGVEGTFLVLHSPRADVAGGAPLLDASGAVAAVLLQVKGADKTLAVPAGALRSALLGAGAELKPLAQLPRPLWPISVVTVAGEPPSAGQFAGIVRAIKNTSRCAGCRGTGKVTVSKVTGQQRIGGMVRPIVQNVQEPCPKCRGDGVLFSAKLYDQFSAMAAGATQLVCSPDVDANIRTAAAGNGLDLLHTLGKVGGAYRAELIQAGAADLASPAATLPRGVVVYAQHRGVVDGPDGKYVLLAPHQSAAMLAARSDLLSNPPAKDDDAKVEPPELGDWLVLAAIAEGPVRLGAQQATYVRPFGWVYGPVLGRLPAAAGEERPRKRRDGESKRPNFFGL
jgi:hypothetical protein